MREYWLDPPEYDDPCEAEDERCDIEIPLDAVIIVDSDGDYDWEDSNYSWAMDGDDDCWYSDEYSVCLTDSCGVVERADSFLLNLLPNNLEPGRYHVCGDLKLAWSITGITYWATFHGLDEDGDPDIEREYDTDDADVDYLYQDSSLSNFSYEKIQ